MHQAQLIFSTPGPPSEREVDLVIDLLDAWCKNGQLASTTWSVAARDRALVAHVVVPETHSVEDRHANVYVRASEKALSEALIAAPTVEWIGIALSHLACCACAPPQNYILFAHYRDTGSPVRCAGCFLPVPLYRLGRAATEEYFDVLQWADDHRACDTLQMHCSVGEQFAETQLSSLTSELNVLGRRVVASLARSSGARIYYYLNKARGKSHERELARRCPQCDGEWLQPSPWHGMFHFRCDRCQLLSNIAWNAPA